MWTALRRSLRNLRRLVCERERDQLLDDEIRFHLAQEVQLRIERGHSEKEAAAAVRREFGSVALAVENTRAVWMPVWLDQCLQDLRIAARMPAKAPAYFITAVL